jgi:hypothetical protein
VGVALGGGDEAAVGEALKFGHEGGVEFGVKGGIVAGEKEGEEILAERGEGDGVFLVLVVAEDVSGGDGGLARDLGVGNSLAGKDGAGDTFARFDLEDGDIKGIPNALLEKVQSKLWLMHF